MPPPSRALLKQTDHGRSEGWDVELEGRAVAYLDEPRWEDMFWVSYRITPVTDDEALAARLLSEEFWRGDGWQGVRFRSRALGLVAPNAFPSIEPFVGPARLNMRALYLTGEAADKSEAADTSEDRPHVRAVGLIRKLWGLLRRGAR